MGTRFRHGWDTRRNDRATGARERIRTRVDRPSIPGNAYFDFIPAPAAHFTLVQENGLFPAVMATVLYASILLENVSTPEEPTAL